MVIKNEQEKAIREAYIDDTIVEELARLVNPRVLQNNEGIQLYDKLVYVPQKLRTELTRSSYRLVIYRYQDIEKTPK